MPGPVIEAEPEGYVRSVTVRATTWVSPMLLVVTLLTSCTQNPGSADRPETPATSLAASSSSTISSRPTLAGTLPTASPRLGTSTIDTRPDYVFPVRAKSVQFGRTHHDYPATDIFAPCGSAVLAVTDAVVTEVSRQDLWTAPENSGATRGGLSVSVTGTDGVRYYGSHLKSIEASIVPGVRVRRGDVLGRVGHTGSARPTSCHLHFGISPPCAQGDWWNRRGVVSPYSFLTSWQDGGRRSPVPAVAAWRAKHGCR